MKPLIVLPIVLLFSSCASIVSKSQYPVSLTSSPSGCKVVVKKNGEIVHQATTPSTVTLSSRGGYFQAAKYEVEFSKKGLPTQTVPLAAEMNGWYFGNFLFGGLIGLLIVDPATGAMWKLPENVNAPLAPLASLTDDNGRTLRIVDRSTIPASLESQLIAVR